jgi:hypothetical protein
MGFNLRKLPKRTKPTGGQHDKRFIFRRVETGNNRCANDSSFSFISLRSVILPLGFSSSFPCRAPCALRLLSSDLCPLISGFFALAFEPSPFSFGL